MRVRVQVVIDNGEDGEGGSDEAWGYGVHDVAALVRPAAAALRPEELGLTLAEAKAVLRGVQRVLVATQATAYAAARRRCPACGATLRCKGQHRTQARTLFGTVPLTGPRLFRCRCAAPAARAAPAPAPATFSPLAELLPEHVAPERLYLEAKWAALVSYGLTARLLADVLPLDDPVSATTVRRRLHRVAVRAEAVLGDERWSFIEGCPAEWAALPRPPAPLTVGLDGGYVRGWADKRSHFEVIVGKAVPEEGRATCFGFVPGRGAKPRRRLYEALRGHGLQANQQVTFLSDGGDTVRDLQFYLSPESEHVLDWFHVTMRLTVLGQYAKGLGRTPRLRGQPPPREEALALLERTKHFLWHGNVLRALETLDDLAALAALLGDPEAWDGPETDDEEEGEEEEERATRGGPAADARLDAGEAQAIAKLERGVAEFRGYIDANAGFIPNYGERHRQGEAIATGFVESTVNAVVSKRFAKRQQMQWTPKGAHLLLQVRTKVLNGELDGLFREWYPGFRPAPAEADADAA
jgi:hypothetical protein